MKPIPVEERLPALEPEGRYHDSKPALAYDAFTEQWYVAVYREIYGALEWVPWSYGLGLYELEDMEVNITHWLPLPDAPGTE